MKPWQVNRIVEVFIPEVNCWEFSKVVSWLTWPWCFICKVNSTNRYCFRKIHSAVSQALGEDALVQNKCFVGMRGRSGGVSSAWWHVRTAFEVCFVGLVVARISVWFPVIVFIFMGFGQVGAKSCGGCLKVISWGWWCKSRKGALMIGKAGSHYVIFLYCKTLLQVLLGIYCKRFYWIPLFTIQLFYVFEVGKAKSATQSFLMVLTLNSVSLTLPLSLVCFFSPL